MDEHAETIGAERDQGGRVGIPWEQGADLCPLWWPRRPVAARRPRSPDAPADLLAADRLYAALTLLAATFEIGDNALVHEVRDVAIAHTLDGAARLASGAEIAWGPGDEVGPAWPRGPLAAGTTPGLPLGPGGVSERALTLLDALGLLHSYSLAARLADPAARRTATAAIGTALVEHARVVASSFG